MLKLKEIKTKPVTYQGLKVNVPEDTNFMWLRHNARKTVLMAAPNKPVWHHDHNLYIPTSDSTVVARLEHVDLTVEQVKDSLESEECVPTAQDLKQLSVIKNLAKNMHGFANNLERLLAKVEQKPDPKSIQALLQFVYSDDGELDSLYNSAIHEAAEHGIVDVQDEESECYEDLVKFINTMLK